MRHALVTLGALLGPLAAAPAQTSFVNWESPHVSPIALTPDRSRLLAVNTADNRLEIFAASDTGLAHLASVPVGLDPVTVRARSDSEAWVVNHVSDTITIVDLTVPAVTATLPTGDEPTDVVFAGAPPQAFVTASQLNRVEVYDPLDLARAPVVIDVEGEDPRALTTDGAFVYVAIFEAGNGTTVLNEQVVSSGVNPYPGNPNPPPNRGEEFDPPIDSDLPTPPEVSIIVRRAADGRWLDVNDADWSEAVEWDLHDHDVAVIDAETLAVTYVSGLLNANMGIAAGPGGVVAVVGTEAMNEVRFEPNVRGTFVRVMGATFTAGDTTATTVDLNPHLDYTTSTVAQALRDQSIGDPRGVAWSGAGDRLYVTGLGSNNVVVTGADLAREGRVEVGEGPTGIVLDEARDALYVLNKFEATVSRVDVSTLVETGRVAFYDPTPGVIRAGRPHLYGTHGTSGLGQASCASCHIDGRTDQVGWDLGDPTGEVKPFDQVCNFGFGGCEDWHPMKGPMATQTLQGIIGTEPLHWRGDRGDFGQFNGAFESLLGDDEQLTEAEMDEFEDFVATITYPPNPFRTRDNGFQTTLPNGGRPVTGFSLFRFGGLDGINCVDCHALPTGTNGQLTSAALIQESQSMKIPQLRNMHEKTGFAQDSMSNNRGFGYIHDGSVDTLFNFLQFDGFQFAGGEEGDQQRRNVEAYMLSFSEDTHAGVGSQATIGGLGPDQTALRDELLGIAGVGLVVKGRWDGEQRGAHHLGGDSFQTDRAAETLTTAELDDRAGPDAALTYTLVPLGSEGRIGVDRDEDGFFDRDELDACSDPADPDDVPGTGGCGCPADVDGDGVVGTSDLIAVIASWGPCGSCPADINEDGVVDTGDLVLVLGDWGACE